MTDLLPWGTAVAQIFLSYVIAIERRKQSYVLYQQEKRNQPIPRRCRMKKEYDFTNAKKNPYSCKLKQQITINIDRSEERRVGKEC